MWSQDIFLKNARFGHKFMFKKVKNLPKEL